MTNTDLSVGCVSKNIFTVKTYLCLFKISSDWIEPCLRKGFLSQIFIECLPTMHRNCSENIITTKMIMSLHFKWERVMVSLSAFTEMNDTSYGEVGGTHVDFILATRQAHGVHTAYFSSCSRCWLSRWEACIMCAEDYITLGARRTKDHWVWA